MREARAPSVPAHPRSRDRESRPTVRTARVTSVMPSPRRLQLAGARGPSPKLDLRGVLPCVAQLSVLHDIQRLESLDQAIAEEGLEPPTHADYDSALLVSAGLGGSGFSALNGGFSGICGLIISARLGGSRSHLIPTLRLLHAVRTGVENRCTRSAHREGQECAPCRLLAESQGTRATSWICIATRARPSGSPRP
jgi:hypothetical protein